MAVNKNFVVKNGLEVNTDLLFADSATRAVGVGSTSPNFDLDVRGGIGATDLRVTGFTTLTKDFQVGASGSAFYVSNTNNLVGVGTSVPAFLMDIRSSVSTGQTALYVKGDMRVTGDINLDDLTIDDLTVTGIATYKPDGSGGSPDSWIDIDYTGNTTTGGGTTVGFGSTAYFVDEAKVVFGAGEDLTIGHVGGLNVIGGAVKFNDTTQSSSKDTGSVILEGGAGIEKNLFVGGGAEVTGLTTITGVLDANDTTQSSSSATGAAKFAGGVGVAKNLFVGGGAHVGAAFTINSGIGVTIILDEDDMASNSATALASQQSIKTYVDTQITAEDLDFAGGTGTGSVDLDSQSLTIAGTASQVETTASGQTLTVKLADNVIVSNACTVTGIGSFLNDVNFRGKSGLTSAFWDKTESSLKFNDGGQAQFGDSQDLSIYHNGSHSYIQDEGTGSLYIDSNQLYLRNADTDNVLLYTTSGGAVRINYNGNQKIETNNDGTVTTGIATADGLHLVILK